MERPALGVRRLRQRRPCRAGISGDEGAASGSTRHDYRFSPSSRAAFSILAFSSAKPPVKKKVEGCIRGPGAYLVSVSVAPWPGSFAAQIGGRFPMHSMTISDKCAIGAFNATPIVRADDGPRKRSQASSLPDVRALFHRHERLGGAEPMVVGSTPFQPSACTSGEVKPRCSHASRYRPAARDHESSGTAARRETRSRRSHCWLPPAPAARDRRWQPLRIRIRG